MYLEQVHLAFWLIRSNPKHRARLTIKHSDVRESADLGTEERKKNWYLVGLVSLPFNN